MGTSDVTKKEHVHINVTFTFSLINFFMPTRWLKIIRNFILPILVGILLGTFMIIPFENSMTYFPHKYPEGNWQPERYGLTVEDCYFTTKDNVKLHGWLAVSPQARATLLWCHGNAGNITHRLDQLERLLALNINVFIFDYRGYGRSEGKPSEEGLYQDAVAAYDFLMTRKEIDSANIIVFGQSLGSAPAVELATQRPCTGLILEAAFSSAADVAKTIVRWFPIHLFLSNKFDSYSKIGTITASALFIHGSNDGTIPIALGKKLFEAAKEPKWFYEIPGADHNDTYVVGGVGYFQRIDEFISTVTKRK